jgi:hypothetical protein
MGKGSQSAMARLMASAVSMPAITGMSFVSPMAAACGPELASSAGAVGERRLSKIDLVKLRERANHLGRDE